MQERTLTLSQAASKLNLTPNTPSAHVMKIQNQQHYRHTLKGLEGGGNVHIFGHVVETTGGTESDIKSRINKPGVILKSQENVDL